MFLPSKKMIKEQLEWLIEQKYMRRDDDDINTFIYMAWLLFQQLNALNIICNIIHLYGVCFVQQIPKKPRKSLLLPWKSGKICCYRLEDAVHLFNGFKGFNGFNGIWIPESGIWHLEFELKWRELICICLLSDVLLS